MKFSLEEQDWNKLSFKTRFICDRIPKDSKENVLLDGRLTPISRKDMYWVEVFLDRKDLGAVVIEPSLVSFQCFSVQMNHCKIELSQFTKLAGIVKAWFILQPEYKYQQDNIKKLQEFFAEFGGYDNFNREGMKVRREHEQNALKLVKENMELLKSFRLQEVDSKKVDEVFQNCYFSTESCYSGIGHVMYLYERVLEGKE